MDTLTSSSSLLKVSHSTEVTPVELSGTDFPPPIFVHRQKSNKRKQKFNLITLESKSTKWVPTWHN
jgi:hypothetical protein